MNKRRPEASSLRTFFHDQITHLQSLLEQGKHQRENKKQQAQLLSNAIESVVDGTDARLRILGSYQNQLRDSVKKMLAHIDQLVAGMPPAIRIDSNTVVTDPAVKRYFESKAAIQKLFDDNAEIKAFFDAPEHEQASEVYSLLMLSCRRKTILGTETVNDMVLSDVQQTHISFYGHQLVAAEATEEDARKVMTKTLFDSVIAHLKNHFIQLRHQRTNEEKIYYAQHPEENIDNPEVYLKLLIKELTLPAELIKLKNDLLCISSMGIKLDSCGEPTAENINLNRLNIGEARRLVSLVCYPRGGI